MTTSTSLQRREPRARRRFVRDGIVVGIVAASSCAMVGIGSDVGLAISAPVPLGTAANYSVLGGSAVTNTGPSVLALSAGVSPDTSMGDFSGPPEGTVLGTVDINNGVAQQAQVDLTVAYDFAAGAPFDARTTADLGNTEYAPGVYAGPSPGKGAIEITGPMVLNAHGDANAVFIFQTDSSLTANTGSTVTLLGGAQACNVFWQVGSSATLNGSVFVGNVLALTSISLGANVTVDGRALARNGAVTLIDDVFNSSACVVVPPDSSTTTTTADGGTATTVDGGSATTVDAGAATTVAGGGTATTTPGAGVDTTVPAGTTPGDVTATTTPITPAFNVTDLTLPRTGRSVGSTSLLACVALVLGGLAVVFARRRGHPASR